MNEPAIKVEGLGKKYKIGQREKIQSFRETVSDLATAPFRRIKKLFGGTVETRSREKDNTIWALRDISFEVEPGEVVGVIGRNGSGKTTLLKILSRITNPTEGYAKLNGRVGSLLEVGTGFHQELTGRENVYLSGAILGMAHDEIEEKYDQIVEFSGVEGFMDTPVKRYSSGMKVRLGFAVAAHLDPEILLIDEVLAVGDAAFQKKCIGKMEDVAKEGRTVLFVSHDMNSITNLTDRCLLLEDGRIKKIGNSEKIVNYYLDRSLSQNREKPKPLQYYRRDNDDSPVRVTGIGINGIEEDIPEIGPGQPIQIKYIINSDIRAEGTNVSAILKNSRGKSIFHCLSWDDKCFVDLTPGDNHVFVTIRNTYLVPGFYLFDLGINRKLQTRAWDVLVDYPGLRVINEGENKLDYKLDRNGDVFCPDIDWQIVK